MQSVDGGDAHFVQVNLSTLQNAVNPIQNDIKQETV